MKSGKKVNGKKIALGTMAIVAIGGSLAGGFVAGTKNTENKYSYTSAENNNYKELEESLKKTQDALTTTTQERDRMDKELQALKESGRPEDAGRISELESSIQSKDGQISALEKQVQDLETQMQDNLYAKLCQALLNGYAYPFSGDNYLIVSNDGSENMICYNKSTGLTKELPYRSINSTIEWNGNCYAVVDGYSAMIKVSLQDFSTKVISESMVHPLDQYIKGTDANGEECLLFYHSGYDYIVKMDKDDNLKHFSSDQENLPDIYLIEPVYGSSVFIAVSRSDQQRHIYMYENGEFTDCYTFNHDTNSYGWPDGNQDIIYIADSNNITYFKISTKQGVAFSRENLDYGVLTEIGTPELQVILSVDDKIKILNFDTMSVETLEQTWSGEENVNLYFYLSSYGHAFVLGNAGDGSKDLICINADGTHEVVKKFEADHSYQFTGSYCDENTYQLSYIVDSGETESFWYSFVEE